jgi:hypothetical protein
MPIHDWTRVEAGIFHDFHTVWIGAIRNALNEGLLPKGYYALAEQHAGRFITDVLTLHASPEPLEPLPPWPPDTGGIAVVEAPPRVRRRLVFDEAALALRRSLAIRHVSGHRLIALIEIVSPANKDRPENVEEFATKAASALDRGVHLLVVDLFPPGLHDPQGMNGAIAQRLTRNGEAYESPTAQPLTLASYVAGPLRVAYLEDVAVGSSLSDMPLFLRPDRYVNVPLETTYESAYRGMPAFWREVLEEPPG